MSRWDSDRAWRINALAAACAVAGSALGMTLLDVGGNTWEPFRLVFWGLPAVLCVGPLAFRRSSRFSRPTRIAVAVVLWVLTAFTFTVVFVPAAILMLVAAGAERDSAALLRSGSA
jgi:hypothetical protein